MLEFIAFLTGAGLMLIICQVIRANDAIYREENHQLKLEIALLKKIADSKRSPDAPN